MQPKQTFEELKQEISAQHAKLSRRLRQIAEYAIAEPDHTALETVASIAAKANVPPSSLIRFAKHFGYDGFTDMQRIFRSRLIDRASNYNQRIRNSGPVRAADIGSPSGVLRQFVEADVAALQRLGQEARPQDLARAIELLASARLIGLVAQRRSFPIAAYLFYALSHLGRQAVLIDGLGAMHGEQLQLLGEQDAIIAASFPPYARGDAVHRECGAGARGEDHRHHRPGPQPFGAPGRRLLRDRGWPDPGHPLPGRPALPRRLPGRRARPASGSQGQAPPEPRYPGLRPSAPRNGVRALSVRNEYSILSASWNAGAERREAIAAASQEDMT